MVVRLVRRQSGGVPENVLDQPAAAVAAQKMDQNSVYRRRAGGYFFGTAAIRIAIALPSDFLTPAWPL